MKPLRSHRSVPDDGHMGKRVEDSYLGALRLLNLAELSRETGRGYRTLKSYRTGERRITEAAAKELVEYLRARSDKLSAAADALAAALEEEERNE